MTAIDLMAQRYTKHATRCKQCRTGNPCASARLILMAMASIAIIGDEAWAMEAPGLSAPQPPDADAKGGEG